MAVGGIAVRISSEMLSSGSLRVKRSTAEQFFGADNLATNAPVTVTGPATATCNTLPVRIQLRSLQPTGGQLQGDSTLTLPLHCELCGLGAWLRGQGAAPGVHWVQLWRGAGGALMLRLCDGKPMGLPGEEAVQQEEEQEQQTLRGQRWQLGGAALGAVSSAAAMLAVRRCVATAPGSTTGRTGSTGPFAAAAAAATAAAGATAAAAAVAAGAAGLLVGAAAQDVADAAAPWELSRRSLAKGPAAGRAAAEACAVRQPAAAATAGHERPATLPAAYKPCPITAKDGRSSTSGPLGYGSRAPLAQVQNTVGGSGKAIARGTDGVSGVAKIQPLQKNPATPAQRSDSSHSAAHRPRPPAPPPPTLPDPFQAAAAAPSAPASSGPVVHSVRIGPDRLALLGASALGLWPWADTLRPGQRRIVVLCVFVPGRGAAKHKPEARDMAATLFRINIDTWALEWTGMSVRAGDTLRLAQGPDGIVWAWLQRQPQQQQPRRQRHPQQQQQLQQPEQLPHPQQQQQQQEPPPQQQQPQPRQHGHTQQQQIQQHQLPHQRRQQQHPSQPPRVPAALLQGSTGSGTLMGTIHGSSIDFPREAARAFWRHELGGEEQRYALVTLHVAGGPAGGGCGSNQGTAGRQAQHGALDPFPVHLACYHRPGASWRMSGISPLLAALGAANGDRVLLTRLPDGRVEVQRFAGAEQDTGHAAKRPHQVASGGRQQPSEGRTRGEGEEEEGRDPQRAAKRARLLEGSVLSAGHNPTHHQQHHQQLGEQLQQQQQQVQGAARPAAGQGPPIATATAQAPRLPMPDLTGSVLAGNARETYLELRLAAVGALFPAALGFPGGQSMEVEVHAAASKRHLGNYGHQQQRQQGLASYRLQLTRRKHHRACRLSGCGPLFRALGARNRDAIFMRRLPGDSRIVVEMEKQEARRKGSSRPCEEEWDLSETSEEEDDVELDDGDSGEEDGHGGDGGEEETGEEEEEEGEGVGAVFCLGASGCGRVAGGRTRQHPGAVGGSGGWWGGREEVGAGCDGDGEEEGDESDVEEEDLGLNCWLPAGEGEGSMWGEGSVESEVEEETGLGW